MAAKSDPKVDLYAYLLATGSQESVLTANVGAFAKLEPEELNTLFARLEETGRTEQERPTHVDPEELARIATNVEVASPGRLATVLDVPAGEGSRFPTLLAAIAHRLPRGAKTLAAFNEWAASLDDDGFE